MVSTPRAVGAWATVLEVGWLGPRFVDEGRLEIPEVARDCITIWSGDRGTNSSPVAKDGVVVISARSTSAVLAVPVSSLNSGWLLGLIAGSDCSADVGMSLLFAGPVAVVLGIAVKKRKQNSRVIVTAVPASTAANNFCWLCFFLVFSLAGRG